MRTPLFAALSENNMPLLMIKSMDMSLEDIFLQITENGIDVEDVSDVSDISDEISEDEISKENDEITVSEEKEEE